MEKTKNMRALNPEGDTATVLLRADWLVTVALCFLTHALSSVCVVCRH